MANRYRGEIDAELDGKPHTLCLTLGCLAELETAFAQDSLTALADRFSAGRLAAHEILTILHLGLKGGGHACSRDEVAMMQVTGGAAGAVRLVSNLLAATFGVDETPDKGEAPHP